MLRAFLLALIDPMHPDLDYLRADPQAGIAAREGRGMTQEERDRPQWGPTAALAYRCLWDHINGPGAWALNPWVAAYSFRPVLGNIDRIGEVS